MYIIYYVKKAYAHEKVKCLFRERRQVVNINGEVVFGRLA